MNNKLENQKKMKEVRDQRPLRSLRNYEKLDFISSDSRFILLKKVKDIKTNLENFDSSVKEKAIKIGKLVFEFKNELQELRNNSDKPFSIRECYEVQFGKDIRRINEYCAAYEASLTAVNDQIQLSSLIILGQALNSKDQRKKEIAENALRENTLPGGIKLNCINVKDLSSHLSTSIELSQDKIKEIDHDLKNVKSNISILFNLIQTKNYNSSAETKNKLEKILNDLSEISIETEKCISIMLPSTTWGKKNAYYNSSNYEVQTEIDHEEIADHLRNKEEFENYLEYREEE